MTLNGKNVLQGNKEVEGPMKELPPMDQWLTVKEVAKLLGVSKKRVWRAHYDGRKSFSGSTVKLEMFKTLDGLVTTRTLIDEFHQRLNG